VIACVSIGAKYAIDNVKLTMLNNEPTAGIFFEHVQTKFPEFWDVVFSGLEKAMINIYNSSIIMWTFSVVTVMYGCCMCCWRPYSKEAECETTAVVPMEGTLVAGDLTDTLSSAGKFTVFAPTDKAFKALPAGTLDNLMKPENKAKLVDILKYHVLPEEVLSSQLKPFQAVKTVEGNPLHVQEWGGKVRVGPSLLSKDLKNVTKADNLASNGVVHIINGVLLPPSSFDSLLLPAAQTPPAKKQKQVRTRR